MLRLALAQINTTVGDLAGNCKKILDTIVRAKRKGADIVVFPELAVTGYPPEDLLYKEHFVQDNIKHLRALAKKVSKITAIVGFVDVDRQKRIYNAAAIITNGRIKGVYHKRDLPNYGVFDEKRYFTEGKNNSLFSLNGTKVGLSICEDIWREKGVYQEQRKGKARILINLSSSPYDFGKLKQREDLLIRRAKKAQAVVCYANLVGGQDELVFDGGSLMINPQGKIVASGKQFEEDLVFEGNVSEKFTQTERIYKALVLGTKDYIRKNGFKKVVIGLSGGIDSSVVAAIAVDAVGKENVIGISMPSQFTSKGTKADAKKVAGNLKIRYIEVPIQGIFATFLFVLRGNLHSKRRIDVAEENLQARIRGNILMTFSNKYGWLVLTTGNKSEVAVGYCTLYGDMTGGFAVIKDVPKTRVYELAKLINKCQKNVIPESVVQRAPTAELRKNQKDQDVLPAYEVLDPLLKDYVEEHRSLAQMTKKCNKKLAQEIIKMVDKSEYKRRQSPPGIKITPRAFGKDWRLPITNKYKEF